MYAVAAYQQCSEYVSAATNKRTTTEKQRKWNFLCGPCQSYVMRTPAQLIVREYIMAMSPMGLGPKTHAGEGQQQFSSR